MSFSENVGKYLSNRYGKKVLDSAKKFTTNAIKTASKRAIQKTTEATGVGNKIADKVESVSKKSSSELHSRNDDANSEIEVPKKDIYLQKKGKKLLMNLG